MRILIRMPNYTVYINESNDTAWNQLPNKSGFVNERLANYHKDKQDSYEEPLSKLVKGTMFEQSFPEPTYTNLEETA